LCDCDRRSLRAPRGKDPQSSLPIDERRSFAEGSFPSHVRRILACVWVVVVVALADCGLARVGAEHVTRQHFAPLVELRIDSDWGLVLFGLQWLVAVKG
jgi:hypothetical protein